MSDLCVKCGKTRHPLPYAEWMEAVKQEDLLECGHVVNRAPRQWRQLRESYERYWSQPSELDQLRHQLQQAEARVAELEEVSNDLLNDCINFDGGNLTDRIIQKASKVLKAETNEAFILRKQAEAVEEAIVYALRTVGNVDPFEVDIHKFASDYAQRQQANELENQ